MFKISPRWIPILGAAVFSAGFSVLTAVLLRRWLAPDLPIPGQPLEPVTFFRPIKSREPGLRTKLLTFLSSLEPGDQVLFGTTDEPELTLCKELAERFAPLEVLCIPTAKGFCKNPKINKLVQMESLARYPRWIILDSDTLADRVFLQAFRSEWQTCQADALSAPYALARGANAPARLDAAASALALWPGVALLRAFSRVDFLTGACMAVKANFVQRMGGFRILGDELAEDHALGHCIANLGGSVAIARAILPLDATRMTWREFALHQHRTFATFRRCNPGGSLGLPLTHGCGLSFFWLLQRPLSPVRWLTHLALFGSRLFTARALPGPRPAPHEVWLSGLLDPVFWILSRLPLPVSWAGKWNHLSAQWTADRNRQN